MNLPQFLRIAIVALVAGVSAFLITRQFSPPVEGGDEISWLIEEFKLDDEQANQVRDLHAAFRPICEAHCAEIITAQQALDTATEAQNRLAATQELAALKHRCHAATYEHIQTVAAVMSPDQGERYLRLITPLLSEHAHEEPFGLR